DNNAENVAITSIKTMNRSKQNIERLAILNAWVTSSLVLLNLLIVFAMLNFRSLASLPVIIVTAGTIGGAASNYRRLQEAYVDQLGKSIQSKPKPLQIVVEQPADALKTHLIDGVANPSTGPDIGSNTDVSIELSNQLSKPQLPEPTLMEDEAALLLLKLQIFLSPVFGGLFAFVLYGVFASGIIQGEIFPQFKGTDDDYTTPYEFASRTVPATNEDVAKAALWAFIAGFAEGFVPNFIDKLVKTSEEEE
ncbi:MAG: hypothetical protein WBA10_04430, partial [Elainellaceae cyanobacterium]